MRAGAENRAWVIERVAQLLREREFLTLQLSHPCLSPVLITRTYDLGVLNELISFFRCLFSLSASPKSLVSSGRASRFAAGRVSLGLV